MSPSSPSGSTAEGHRHQLAFGREYADGTEVADRSPRSQEAIELGTPHRRHQTVGGDFAGELARAAHRRVRQVAVKGAYDVVRALERALDLHVEPLVDRVVHEVARGDEQQHRGSQ
jgi:hypothetical protein